MRVKKKGYIFEYFLLIIGRFALNKTKAFSNISPIETQEPP